MPDLDRRVARDRLHIVDGLLAALDDCEAILSAIQACEDRPQAIERLRSAPFRFSDMQAQHVLDMTWSRSTKLGRRGLDEERAVLVALLEG